MGRIIRELFFNIPNHRIDYKATPEAQWPSKQPLRPELPPCNELPEKCRKPTQSVRWVPQGQTFAAFIQVGSVSRLSSNGTPSTLRAGW